MQQNMLILMVVLLVVAVVAIVAVVFLMGGEQAAPVVPEIVPGDDAIIPPAPVPSPSLPTTPTGNVICQISAEDPESETSATGIIKIEKPDKLSMEISMEEAGMAVDLVALVNGDTLYMMFPIMFGDVWIQTSITEMATMGTDLSDMERIMGMSAEEIEAEMTSNPSDSMMVGGIAPEVSCEATGDIADSEFMPPAGAVVKTIQEMEEDMAALYGA
jgi:hypothetical protein